MLSSLFGAPVKYDPQLKSGFWPSLLWAVLVFIIYSVVQAILGIVIAAIYFGNALELTYQVRGMILSTLPAAVIAAGLCYALAGRGGSDRADVLSLRWPPFGIVGWLVVMVAFLAGLYLLLIFTVFALNIEVSQYTPNADGSSPETGSAGLVKEAMFALSNNPVLFWVAFVSVALGAPLAEEFIFRGQLFAALSKTRLGQSGTVVVTSVLWSALHLTEPLLSVFLVFVMGLVLGGLLLRFRSLYLTMACHGVWNAVYSLLVHYG